MRTAHAQLVDIPALQASWQAVDAMAHLRPIHNEADYARMVSLMNALLEVAGKLGQFFGISPAVFVLA